MSDQESAEEPTEPVVEQPEGGLDGRPTKDEHTEYTVGDEELA